MAKYLDEKGFFIADPCFDDPQPFVFVLGGRGIGKTYSATRWLCDHCDHDSKFLFMRRTDNEMQFINTGNIYSEHHPDVALHKENKIAVVTRGDGDLAEPIGYHVALSTIHNIRGFSMTDVNYILFDEFIPERGTVVRRYAGEQMLNAYETVNRNRELLDRPPVKCIFLSNFNTTESDIMAAFGFTDQIYNLYNARPIGVWSDEYKKLIMINETPVSEKKRKTALYNVAHNREFERMAIENDGSAHYMPVKNYSRTAYEYLGTLGHIRINRLYSGYYYLTESAEMGEEITNRSLLRYVGVYNAYLLGNVFVSSTYVETLFLRYFEKKSE